MAGWSFVTVLKSICSKQCLSFSHTNRVGGIVIETLTRNTIMIHENSPSTTREFQSFVLGLLGHI